MLQSNQIMSDELKYVTDRKKLMAQLGNSLDRPSLLMHRQTNAETKGTTVVQL